MRTKKLSKFLLKTILVLPFVYFFWSMVYQKDLFHDFFFAVIFAFVISVGIVFYQVFDYEKCNDMLMEDFLESAHKLTLENTDGNWKAIKEIIASNITGKILLQNETNIRFQIEQNICNSILSISRDEDQISMEIKRKIIGFLPDNARNYRIIKRLERRVKAFNKL